MIESGITTLKSWMAASSETLAIILNQGVYPDPPEWRQLKAEDLDRQAGQGLVYTLGLAPIEGQLELYLSRADAGRLVDLLVGGDGTTETEDLTDLHLNVLGEALNQLATGLADTLTMVTGRPAKVRLGEGRKGTPNGGGADNFVWVDFPLSLDEGPKLQLSLVLPTGLVTQLAPGSAQEATPEAPKAQHQAPRFEPLEYRSPRTDGAKLDLILDVPLQVQVVLGRTSVLVSELINLGEGSILELDRLAGEPVELYVHDRLVAYAEVVVIDEKFGVKILDLAQEQRAKNRSTVVG